MEDIKKDIVIKHILLTYLSDVKTRFNNDKKENEVSASEYPNIGNCKEDRLTMMTNESALIYLLKNTMPVQVRSQDGSTAANMYPNPIVLDKIFVFATQKILGDIAIKKNAFKVSPNGEPKQTMSHFEFFRRRAQRYIKNIDSVLPVCGKDEINPYVCRCEDKEDTAKGIQTVITMAVKIINYINALDKKYDKEGKSVRIILHADLTGGPRDAVMIMLSVMRLLAYRGIEIGHVLYSRYDKDIDKGEVYEAREIYNLLDFISSASEFVRFGSVEGFQDYFWDDRSQTKVLQTMMGNIQHFANTIKMCRRSQFYKAGQELQRAIGNFDKEYAENAEDLAAAFRNTEGYLNENNRWKYAMNTPTRNDALIKLVERRIKTDYEDLWKNDKDDFSRIRWCLDHGYVQQALTLYIECLPSYVVGEGKLLYLTKEQKECLKRYKDADDKRSDEFYVLNAYHVDKKQKSIDKEQENIDERKKKGNKKTENNTNDPFNQSLQGKLDIYLLRAMKRLFRDWKEEKNIAKLTIDIETEAMDYIRHDFPNMVIPFKLKESEKSKKAFAALIRLGGERHWWEKDESLALPELYKDAKEKKCKNIFNWLGSQLNRDKMKQYFGVTLYADVPVDGYPRCRLLWSLIFLNKITLSNSSVEKELYKNMENYYDLKDVRNDVAHAKLTDLNGKEVPIHVVEHRMRESLNSFQCLLAKV